MPSELVSRPATSPEDAARIFTAILIPMHAEVGRAPLDARKTLANIAHCCMREAAYVVEDMSGPEPVIVASIGLVELDFWYSAETYLSEVWFHVAPDYRDGPAAKMILEECRLLAEATRRPVMLAAFNAARQRRTGWLERIGSQVAYAPAGALYAVHGGQHVGQ